MLVSLSPRVTQQILLRSCSVAATTAVNVGSIQQQLLRQCAPSLSSSNSSSQRRSHSTRASYYGQQQQQQRLQQRRQQPPRRPYVVNGKAVAFHVNDLADPSFANTTTIKKSSSSATSNNSKTQSRALANHAAAAVVEDDYDYEETFDAATSTALPKRQYDSDLIVVLDMDECLIHSQFVTNNPGAKFYAHQVARNSSNNKDNNNNNKDSHSKVETFRFHLPDSHDLVVVNQRPHLEAFLEAVTSKYETHIYTAAMKVYAEPILDKLDPTGTRFAQRWYRETCDHDKSMGAYVKNLSNLKFDNNRSSNNKGGLTYDEYLKDTVADDLQASHPLRRVVLVDNNPLSFLSHPTNGILVSSFYNDATDKTLPAVLDLLEELEDLEDVRPTLDARFGLQAALSEIQGNRREQQQKKWVASS